MQIVIYACCFIFYIQLHGNKNKVLIGHFNELEKISNLRGEDVNRSWS